MEFNQADIDAIISAIENDNLTVFVGAGFSKLAETGTIKFPSWGELIENLKSDLDTEEKDFLKIAQLYYLEFGEHRLYKKIKEFIPLYAEPSKEFHLRLFQVLNPKYLITTNWDNLLEKTIVNNGLVYDLIKTEADLVKSTLPRELIKVHGDFDAHNIVFKEDDYLNYSLNNPLFDNLLKHILSTTTVLFLGYSYSDTDLKQIVKWIEKSSKVSPPRFLVLKDSSSSQNSYFKNHGIRVITPHGEEESEEEKFKNLYRELFNSIEKTIKGEYILDNNHKDGNKEGEKTKIELVNYFYKKLIGLSELKCLLPEQITNVFSNCTIEYGLNYFGLIFHNELLTADFNNDVRNLYSNFFKIIKNDKDIKQFSKKLGYIFSCFYSAGIFYIKNGNDSFETKNFLPKYNNTLEIYEIADKQLDNLISFSRDMPKNLFKFLIYKSELEYYDNERKKKETLNKNIEFFEQLSLEVISNLTKKHYLSAMIYKFNKSIIARKLAISNTNNHKQHKKFYEEYIDNFTNELINNNYPYAYKEHLKPLVDLLNFKSIYKYYYDSVIDNAELLNLEENRKNGGFSFGINDDGQRSNARLVQILRFCANNDIALDAYSEFKNLMKSYVLGKIKIHKVREKFQLTKYDLFVLIKYVKFNELSTTISNDILTFIKDKSREGTGDKILLFPDAENIKPDARNIKKYIKDTFDNLSELFKEYHHINENTISRSFQNLIMVIGLIKWEESELNKFIDSIKAMFLNHFINYDCIDATNNFIYFQLKLYRTNNSHFVSFIDVVLGGVISGKFLAPYYQNINSRLSKIYEYSQITGTPYSNEDLMKKALCSLDCHYQDNNETKRYFLQKFFLPIYQISDEKIKGLFTPYFKELRISKWEEVKEENLYDEIFCELDFLKYGCKPRKKFINFMINWVKNTLNRAVFFSLIKAEKILAFINFLVKEKGLSQLKKLQKLLQEEIQSIINDINKSKNL